MSFLTDAWLKMRGQQVNAQVTSVTSVEVPKVGEVPVAGTMVNLGQNVYVIMAVWTDPKTNITYTFEKRCLADHPPAYREGHTIAVTIDPNNPKRYTMKIGC